MNVTGALRGQIGRLFHRNAPSRGQKRLEIEILQFFFFYLNFENYWLATAV
jgi:hypothetical protein